MFITAEKFSLSENRCSHLDLLIAVKTEKINKSFYLELELCFFFKPTKNI